MTNMEVVDSIDVVPQKVVDVSASSQSASPDSSSPSYSSWHVMFVTTLTSVATIIGSGILALPVTLHQTTVPMFLVIFTICLIAQGASVYATIELLQQSRAVLPPPSSEYDSTSSSTSNENPGQDVEDQTAPPRPEISLFTISNMYLPYTLLRSIFHIFSILTFVGILVSYALAGPQALWQLFSPPSAPLQPPPLVFFLFAFIGIISVVFFVNALLPFFSSLTVVKGVLFIAVVFLVMCLPSTAKIMSLSDLVFEKPVYDSVAVSFLMCTVAIGGLGLTIPVTYRLLPENPSSIDVARYRKSVILGLVICYVLNIGWVIAILQVVPRVAGPGQPSLTEAFNEGQITTVPLIESLRTKTLVSPQLLHSVEIIVQLFIIISTVVSFFVMAAGFKNYMDGFVSSVKHELEERNRSVNENLLSAIAYILAFTPIIALVLLNPKGFITVLTRLSGTSINIQAGFLLFLMMYYCHTTGAVGRYSTRTLVGSAQPLRDGNAEKTEESSVPLPLSKTTVWTMIILGSIFFASASFLAAFGPLFGVQLSSASG